MKVIFVCNKYSPAHIYSIQSYSYIFNSDGIDTFLLDDFINDKRRFEKSCFNFISLSKLKNIKDDLTFFFVSPNINNIKTLKTIKKQLPRAKTVYLYHEPINRQVRKELLHDRGFSFGTIKYIIGLSLYNGKKLIKLFDKIILPSKNANDIYEQDSLFRKTNHEIIHLLFKDDVKKNEEEREFLSYIGTVANNHGFPEFVDFLLKMETPKDLNVCIATSSQINQETITLLKTKFNDKITIFSGSFMSDEVISKLYKQTKVLWLGYKHSAQSGVLPMAFMYGTPIICSDIPSFKEFTKIGVNCEIVDINNCSSIEQGIETIAKNFNKYHDGCIKTYNEFFNPKAKYDIVLKVFKNL